MADYAHSGISSSECKSLLEALGEPIVIQKYRHGGTLTANISPCRTGKLNQCRIRFSKGAAAKLRATDTQYYVVKIFRGGEYVLLEPSGSSCGYKRCTTSKHTEEIRFAYCPLFCDSTEYRVVFFDDADFILLERATTQTKPEREWRQTYAAVRGAAPSGTWPEWVG